MFQPTYIHHDKVLTMHLDSWRVLVCKMHEHVCGIRPRAGRDGTRWVVETGEHGENSRGSKSRESWVVNLESKRMTGITCRLHTRINIYSQKYSMLGSAP